MYWMFVLPQNSYAEILIPKEMMLGGGPLGVLGEEAGVLMDGMSALIKENPEGPCPFHPIRTQWEDAGYGPGEGFHENMIVLAPWSCTSSLHNCEKYISVVYAIQSVAFGYSSLSRLRHYPKEMKTCPHKILYTDVHSSSFCHTPNGKQHNCFSKDEWLNKLWYIYATECSFTV